MRAADVTSGDQVLEIGPGPGVLTEALLEAQANVVAIELDSTLAHALERLQKEGSHLKVLQNDVLKTSWREIASQLLNPSESVKLIANLPYHITTPVLAQFAPLFPMVSSITVMVQDEVGKRMAAKAGEADYGSLSLFLSFYADVHYDFKVGRRCFFPAPRVDSAVVTLKLKAAPHGIDPDPFFKITRQAFQQRRKSLRASLRTLFNVEVIEAALEQTKLQPLARPEEISLEQWLILYRFLTNL